MLFTYSFGEKLDLTKFRKQAAHFIGVMNEITYHLYLPDYKMVVSIATSAYQTRHMAEISLYELKRDADGEIIQETLIAPSIDSRFREVKEIQSIFPVLSLSFGGSTTAYFDSNNASETADKLCNLLKLISKINGLKAFL